MLNGPLVDALTRLDKVVPTTDFFKTEKFTIADIFVYCCYRMCVGGFVPGIPVDCVDHCPNILTLKEKFEAMPVIKEHYGL